MKVNILDFNTNKKVLKEIAKIHIKELPNNRAATIGNQKLAYLYKMLMKQGCLKIHACYLDGNELAGALGVISKKPQLLSMLTINAIILLGIIKNPVRWIKETLVFHFLYKNIQQKSIIMFLFVNSENTRKGCASALLSSVILSGVKNLYVDTNVSNTSALEFYYKSGFIRVNQVNTQVLLKNTNQHIVSL